MTVLCVLLGLCSTTLLSSYQPVINPLNLAGRKTGLTEKPYRPERPVNRPLGLPSLSCKLVYRPANY